MVFIRFLALLFAAIFCAAVGSGTNAIAAVCAVLSFPVFIGLYMLPTYEAYRNKQPNMTAIAMVNVLLGWSLIGWVVALVWALKKPEPVLAIATPAPVQPSTTDPIKQCTYCGESVLAVAIKCKHCGSALSDITS